MTPFEILLITAVSIATICTVVVSVAAYVVYTFFGGHTKYHAVVLKKIDTGYQKVRSKKIRATDKTFKLGKDKTTEVDIKRIAYRDRNNAYLFFDHDENKQMDFSGEKVYNSVTVEELDAFLSVNFIKTLLKSLGGLDVMTIILIVVVGVAGVAVGFILGGHFAAPVIQQVGNYTVPLNNTVVGLP